ncbi:MAG: helix-turn-helix transcriptional regulator [Chloroflexi bacterium]|nr:helix-turn-helix transcriptional regulator [Chloroflexota bacterium]
MTDPIRTIDDLETLRLVFDPFRMQVLGMLAHEPLTVKQMAERLETTPHRLYYHIRMMEKAGLIDVVETHLVNGIVEKIYRASAMEYVVKRGLLNFDTDEGMQGFDVLLEETLDKTREDIKRSGRAGLIDAEQTAPHPDALLLRRGLVNLTPEQAERVYTAFLRLLRETLNETRQDAGARPYAVQFAFYPTRLWGEEAGNDG